MEMKDRTHVVLLRIQYLFVICAAEESKHHTVGAERRLDHVGDIFLFLLVVKIGKILSGYILMLSKVIIRSVRDAPQLAPSEWEEEFHVCGSLAVETQFFFYRGHGNAPHLLSDPES